MVQHKSSRFLSSPNHIRVDRLLRDYLTNHGQQ
jgi:hypothetical protein